MTNFVSVEAKVLAKALKLANAIVEARVTIPVLNTVRLSVDANGLTLDATDLDLQASIEVDEIDGSGSWAVCIAARDLANVAAVAGTTVLRIEPASTERDNGKGRQWVEHSVIVTAGDAQYSIKTQPASDFPDLQGERMQRIERFTNGQFPAMLKKVAFCISTEETRYYLNGVNWSAKPQGKRLAATDGHRLAACRYDGNEAGETFSYIIPRKTVNILTSFLDGTDIEIFSVGNGNAIIDTRLDIKAPGVLLRTKLIDGTYPDFDRVIPDTANHELGIRRDEMLTAIRQATAIGGWRGSAVRMFGVEGRLNIETKSPDDDTAKVKTSAPWPDGANEVGVNSRYMTEMVKNCQGSLRLGITDPMAPLTLMDDDSEMTRVVMPMRVPR